MTVKQYLRQLHRLDGLINSDLAELLDLKNGRSVVICKLDEVEDKKQ